MLKEDQNINIFIAFSEKEREHVDSLCTHLMVLKNEGFIDGFWHEGLTLPGEKKHDIYQHNYLISNIILLILSSDFLSNRDLWIHFLEDTQIKGKILIPIIARYCSWHMTELNRFEVLPQNHAPINSNRWHTIEEPYMEIIEKIKNISDLKRKSDNIKDNKISISNTKFSKIRIFISSVFYVPGMDYLSRKYGKLIEISLEYIILFCIVILVIISVDSLQKELKPILTLITVTALLTMAITIRANKKLIYKYIAPMAVIVVYKLKPIIDFISSIWQSIRGR